MPTKTTKKRTGRPPQGRVKVTISLDPQHVEALRAEAFRLAAADPRARPDVSALVREVLDAWLKRRK